MNRYGMIEYFDEMAGASMSFSDILNSKDMENCRRLYLKLISYVNFNEDDLKIVNILGKEYYCIYICGDEGRIKRNIAKALDIIPCEVSIIPNKLFHNVLISKTLISKKYMNKEGLLDFTPDKIEIIKEWKSSENSDDLRRLLENMGYSDVHVDYISELIMIRVDKFWEFFEKIGIPFRLEYYTVNDSGLTVINMTKVLEGEMR